MSEWVCLSVCVCVSVCLCLCATFAASGTWGTSDSTLLAGSNMGYDANEEV